MKLQTKICLIILPLIIGSILIMGWWSIKTASDSIQNSTYQYIDTVLNAYISDTVMRLQDILKRNGLDKVPSFVKQYRKKASMVASNVSLPETGHILILNADGRFVFCTLGEKHSAFQNIDQTMLEKITKNPANTVRGRIHGPDGSEEIFVALYYRPWDWVVLLGMSEKETFAAKNKIRNATIGMVGLSSLSCIIILLVVLRRFFVGPITKLKEAAAAIAGQETVNKIDVSSKDELGLLARSMESMSESIQSYRDKQKAWQKNLEREVQRQTKDLKKINASLTVEISEREKTEKALRESEDRYRVLVESSPIPIFVHSEGEITFLNPEAAKVLGGTSSKDFLGKPVLSILHPDFHDIARERIQAVYDKKASAKLMEAKLLQLDGKVIDVEIAATIIDYMGKPASQVIFNDITERKQAEKEKIRLETHLRQAQKMDAIATLSGGIAHQFNNALTAITVNLDLLGMKSSDNEEIADYTKRMKDSAHRMAQLTSQLLAYAKGGKYHPKILSINDLVESTLSIIKHNLNPSIRVETDLTADTLVKADQIQMQMALSAVLANGSEALESEGLLKITTGIEEIDEAFTKHHPGLKPGSYVCLMVEDSGKGMDEETKSRIFEPFFSTKFQGRGLGMAATFGIVNNHDGWISVDSEIGRGTVVRIYIPAVDAQTKQPEKSGSKPSNGDETVLVIEDEVVLLEVNRKLLEKLGYNVLEARTGKEAVHIARTFDGEIHLAVLDIILSDMEGGAVYPLIMEARPNLKVIVCSGYSIDGPAQEIINSGAQDFIQKPFSMATISEKLKAALEG